MPTPITLHAGFASAYPRREAQAAAADAANDAALGRTIAQAVSPRSPAEQVRRMLAAGMDAAQLADLIDEVDRYIDRRFTTLADTRANAALIDALADFHEHIGTARRAVVHVGGLLGDGVTL